jgi:hypothetical protein
MFGGYPAAYRHERSDGTVDFNFAWFAAKVQSSSDKNFGMVLEISRSISISPTPITADIDLGGWSRGPVFRIADESGIERLELSAIIYEYSAINEIALAHPLIDLMPNGTFRAWPESALAHLLLAEERSESNANTPRPARTQPAAFAVCGGCCCAIRIRLLTSSTA